MSFTEDYYKTLSGLKTLKTGESVELKKTKIGSKDIDLIIEVCKEFIDAGNPDFEFSNDYKFIRRLHAWPVDEKII